MTVSKPHKSGVTDASGGSEREKSGAPLSKSALGEALRANLQRRKNQARARAADDGDGDGKADQPSSLERAAVERPHPLKAEK